MGHEQLSSASPVEQAPTFGPTIYAQQDEIRRAEAIVIQDAGSLIASTRAAISFFLGDSSPEKAAVNKKEILTRYNKASRNERIALIVETEILGRQLAEQINPPGFRETNFAYHARRQNLLVALLKANITQGDEAVDVADILMGKSCLGFDRFALVKEWKAKKREKQQRKSGLN